MPIVLVYGGSGGLGKVIVSKFKHAGFEVVSVDLLENSEAQYPVRITGDGSLEDANKVVQQVKSIGKPVDTVICVAGGFNMNNIKDGAIFSALDRMLSFNLKSAVSCGYVAANTLKEGGLVVFTGASAALNPTPTMLAYGLSKSATHHLIKSLAQPDSGMPKGTTVAAILPITLDTPMNRKDMPTANFDNWTPLDDVAQLLLDWASDKNKPPNGGMVELKTLDKKTTFTQVNH